MLVYERCCRNNSVTNLLNPGSQGATYSVIINAQANYLNNSSPQFSVYPPPFICANTFLAYDHSAVDPDGDSLVYSLCNVRTGADKNFPAPNPPNAPPHDTVTWNAGYGYNSPMGSDSFEINPTTGLLTCTPTQLGQYLVGICISEYRTGQLISHYTRDFQFNVVGCPAMSNNTNYLPYTFDDNLKYGVFKANDSTLTVDFSGLNFHNPAPTNMPLKVLWDFGVPNSNMDTSSLFSPIFTYPDTGSYLATVTITKEVLGREMKVVGRCLINLGSDSLLSDFSYKQTSSGFQHNVNFTDESYTPNKIVGWRWDFGDGQVSFSQNPSHLYSFTTDYLVYLTTYNNFGKSNKILKYVKVQPLSVNDPLKENIQISYNSSGLSINGINEQNLPAKLFIYNIIGEKIIEQNIEQTQSLQSSTQLSNGVYIAKLLNKTGISKSIKFIAK
jgi:PKD repeat protein